MKTIKCVSFFGALAGASLGGLVVAGCGGNDEGGAVSVDQRSTVDGLTDSAGEKTGTVTQRINFDLGGTGFAWITHGTVGPNFSESDAAAGGSISVTNPSAGNFVVSFGNLGLSGDGGNVQVVAYGSGSERCNIKGWSNSGSEASTVDIKVFCHTVTGAAVNTDFVVQYFRRPTFGRAYLWAGQPTSSFYTPSSTYSYNSSGGTNTISRAGVGHYVVTLPGQQSAGGSVQVTAYDFNLTRNHCKLQGWYPLNSGETVEVLCFNNAGALADTQFTLDYHAPGVVDMWSGQGAFTWADQPSTANYTPSTNFAFNTGLVDVSCPNFSGFGTTSAHRTGVGIYRLQHSEIDPLHSSVHTTAYGTDSNYCKVQSWVGPGPGVDVNVRCFSASGAASDSRYVESYASANGLERCF